MSNNLGFLIAAGAALIATGAAGGAYMMNKGDSKEETKDASKDDSKEETKDDSNEETKDASKEDRPQVPLSLTQPIEEAVRQAATGSDESKTPISNHSSEGAVPSSVVASEPVSSPVVASEPAESPPTPYVTPESSPATPEAAATGDQAASSPVTPEAAATGDQAAPTPLRGGRTRCKHCNKQLQYRKKSRRKLIA